jgi:hypothetical protein
MLPLTSYTQVRLVLSTEVSQSPTHSPPPAIRKHLLESSRDGHGVYRTLEQVGGFEPPNSPWKGAMLPLTSYLHVDDLVGASFPMAGASRPAAPLEGVVVVTRGEQGAGNDCRLSPALHFPVHKGEMPPLLLVVPFLGVEPSHFTVSE